MGQKKRARKAAGEAGESSSSEGEDSQPAAAAGPSKANADPAMQRLNKLAETAECPICSEIYTDPRSLTACEHTLCWNCAKPLIKDAKLECPLCRTVSDLAGAGAAVKELPRNRALASMVEMLHGQEHGAGKRAHCGNCEKAAAEVTCGRCELHLCEECSSAIHKPLKMHILKQHDLQRYQPGSIASESSRTFTCPSHAKEPLRYCKEKRVEACLQCISAADHAGHAHTSIAEGAAALGAELAAAVEARKGDVAAVDLLKKQQHLVGARIAYSISTAKAAARTRGKELHACLDVHEANWLAELEACGKAATEEVQRQLERIEAAGQQLREAVRFGSSLSAADPLRVVRIQPRALAGLQLEVVARGGLPQVVEPKGFSFQPSGVEIAVSEGGPVKSGASSGKVRVEVPWKPELEPGAFYHSNTFYCSGWPWQLEVHPKGHGTAKGTHVSLFLVTSVAEFPVAYALKVEKYAISVGNQTMAIDGRLWTKLLSGWGLDDFQPIEKFIADVKDGKFVAEISVENAQLVRVS